MIPLPYSMKKQVATIEYHGLRGKALTLNATPFRGHARGKVLLATCNATPVKGNAKLCTVEYVWIPAESMGGVPPDKIYRFEDHNKLPGVTESKPEPEPKPKPARS